jgi:hypothetical protein
MTSTSNRKVFPAFLALVLLGVGAACDPTSSTVSKSQDDPVLSAVSVSAGGAPSIEVAGTLQLIANGAYQDSRNEISYKDVSASTAWTTSDEAVATVSKGLVTGTGIGTVTISASFGGKSGNITVFVGLAHYMTISPAGPFSLSATPSIQFFATETFPDGSTLDVSGPATWSSSKEGVVSIYPYLGGDATLVAPGTATVTATLDTGEVASVDVTVVR